MVIKEDKPPPLTVDDILLGKGNSKKVEVAHIPGTDFQYSGGGTTILQKVVEVVNAPKTFAETVQELVFAPLKMDHSSYNPDEATTVQGTESGLKPLPGKSHIYPEHAAAGLWSTPIDLAKVAVAIQEAVSGKNEALFSQKLATEMLTPQTESKPNGLGLWVDKLSHSTLFSHAGGNHGFRCILVADTEGKGVAVMTNSDNGTTLWKEIVQACANEYAWPDQNALPMCNALFDTSKAKKQDPAVWIQKFSGSYMFEEHIAKVYGKEGKIFVQVDNDPPFEVTPFNETVGSFQSTTPGPFDKLEFTTDTNNQLSLELWGGNHIQIAKGE